MRTTITILAAIICLHIFAQETSQTALDKLKKGNERFYSEESTYPNLGLDRLSYTAENGQHPYATVITCSDSRVPVENVFDAGVGDIFVIRVAGNVVNTDEAGSIEYGVDHLHTPVLVVLGHSQCGAVTAVVKNAELHGNIPDLVKNIERAAEAAEDDVEKAIQLNVWNSIEDLINKSHSTAELVKDKKLLIIGAVYHLDTGKVEWLGEHPDLANLVH